MSVDPLFVPLLAFIRYMVSTMTGDDTFDYLYDNAYGYNAYYDNDNDLDHGRGFLVRRSCSSIS